jgi:hypothetical protein
MCKPSRYTARTLARLGLVQGHRWGRAATGSMPEIMRAVFGE